MSHLKANEVSVRSRAKANAEFGFLGFTHFPGLVCPDTISSLNAQAKEAVYTKIFNKFKRSDSKRAAAKAGSLGDCVVLEVLAFLTSILIAGRDHKIEMARGASFLRSLHGVMQQDIHTDFDFEDSLVPLGLEGANPFPYGLPFPMYAVWFWVVRKGSIRLATWLSLLATPITPGLPTSRILTTDYFVTCPLGNLTFHGHSASVLAAFRRRLSQWTASKQSKGCIK